MANLDEEFIKKLRATFEAEAEEHLQAISSMLLELEKAASPSQGVAITENVYREVHSLKGAARAVDLSDIEGICQSLESVFSVCKSQKLTPRPEAFDSMHRAVDMIRSILGAPGGAGELGRDPHYDDLIRHLVQLQFNLSGVTENAPPQAFPVQPHAIPPQAPVAQTPVAQPAPIPSADPDRLSTETVRLPVAKLDAQLLQAEDMLTIKAMTAQRAVELRELVGLFAQWRNRWTKFDAEIRKFGLTPKDHHAGAPLSAGASATLAGFWEENGDYFRSIGNRLTAMAAQTEQDRYHVAKHVDDLLEDSKKLLMLPFSTLAGIFPRLIRDLCREQDKEAELVIQGGDIEIDKRILDEMKDPIIHILRNCVSHGVEKRDARERLGKAPKATITIAVAPVNGNKIELLISDDGAGIDLEAVKQSAIRHRVISEADARALNAAGAMSLVFYSEVSTSPAVTTISGRGLGMTIVRSKVDKLGGKIAIESNPGSGTSLRMVLPLTLATFRGILISAARQVFIVPTLSVERVLRVNPENIQSAENRQSITIQGKPVSLVWLSAVLELPVNRSDRDPRTSVPVVVLYSADQRIAFAVDQIMHEEEILAKPLRKPLVRVRNIAGATVLGSGKVVPILNITDLVKSARRYGAAPDWAAGHEPQRQKNKKRLLIVEDSVTSRMLLKGILESAGYLVKTANDGAEAYATLHEGEYDLVVSDVEMPRMNGFDLTARIRSDKRLSELPVVLVTALESREQRERGIDAGASAYIVKSSFDQSDLLEAIQRLI